MGQKLHAYLVNTTQCIYVARKQIFSNLIAYSLIHTCVYNFFIILRYINELECMLVNPSGVRSWVTATLVAPHINYGKLCIGQCFSFSLIVNFAGMLTMITIPPLVILINLEDGQGLL